MIAHLLSTVGPVFLLVLVGFVAVKRALFDAATVDALMRFAIRFAIPCLLFRAVSTLDLGAAYEWRSMTSYYSAAFVCFGIATLMAWRVFERRPGEAVAVGFAALFSNLVVLGLPIVRMTLGEGAMPAAYAIVSVHAPFCYLVGIVSMELLRADGRTLLQTAVAVARAMFRNSLMIGIGLGFLANLSGLTVPLFIDTTLSMIAGSALPVALVGLGGVLARYRLLERLVETVTITAISLVLHPLLVLVACAAFGVYGTDRAVIVLLASMSPGVNVYLFASLYGRGEETAAATVLLGTGVAVASVSLWSLVVIGA